MKNNQEKLDSVAPNSEIYSLNKDFVLVSVKNFIEKLYSQEEIEILFGALDYNKLDNFLSEHPDFAKGMLFMLSFLNDMEGFPKYLKDKDAIAITNILGTIAIHANLQAKKQNAKSYKEKI